MTNSGERWTVGMLSVPLGIGAVVDRRAWPLHVTLAGNFSTSADRSAVVAAVGRAVPGEFERLPGFAPDEPQFWLDGYVPHVTLGPNVVASSGDMIPFATIAVSRLTSREAEVVAEFELLWTAKLNDLT